MDEVIDRLLNEAIRDLELATNGSALCRLSASGSPGTAAKRAEGSWAALNALTRLLAEGGGDPRVHADQLLDKWNADLNAWSSDPRSSWVPYCQGGISALTRYVDELRT